MLASAPASRWNVREIMKIRPLLLALPWVGAAVAQGVPPQADLTGSPPLHEVVITATRIAADAFNVPAAISSISAEQLHTDSLGVNLADDIAVPGLLARNRNNY